MYETRMLRTAAVALLLCLATHADAGPAKIALGELTVRWNGDPIARLHANGHTESVADAKPGKDAPFTAGPVLHADGTIDLTKGGFKARIDADGALYVIDPQGTKTPFGRITGDKLFTASGKAGVRVDGAKLVEFADGKDTSVIGVIDPTSLKRSALVMTAAFFMDMSLVEH